jgi:hypothetical protein
MISEATPKALFTARHRSLERSTMRNIARKQQRQNLT